MEAQNILSDLHSEYDIDAPLTKENMKWETLLLLGELQGDYAIPEKVIKQCIESMYSIIDTCTINSWDLYGQYVDAILQAYYPSLYKGIIESTTR